MFDGAGAVFAGLTGQTVLWSAPQGAALWALSTGLDLLAGALRCALFAEIFAALFLHTLVVFAGLVGKAGVGSAPFIASETSG